MRESPHSGCWRGPTPQGRALTAWPSLSLCSSYHNSALVDHVKEHTKRGKPAVATKRGDRPWNDPGASRWGKKAPEAIQEENDSKPLLRAVVLDFAAVANLDTVRLPYGVCSKCLC
jgi:hypothetical protein